MLGRPFPRRNVPRRAAAAIYRLAFHFENCFVTLLQSIACFSIMLLSLSIRRIVFLESSLSFLLAIDRSEHWTKVANTPMANGQSTNRAIWRVNSNVAAVSVSLCFFLFSLPVNEPTNARGVSRRSTRKYARALASGPTMKHLPARSDNGTEVETHSEPACLPAWLSASPPLPPHFAAPIFSFFCFPSRPTLLSSGESRVWMAVINRARPTIRGAQRATCCRFHVSVSEKRGPEAISLGRFFLPCFLSAVRSSLLTV